MLKSEQALRLFALAAQRASGWEQIWCSPFSIEGLRMIVPPGMHIAEGNESNECIEECEQ